VSLDYPHNGPLEVTGSGGTLTKSVNDEVTVEVIPLIELEMTAARFSNCAATSRTRGEYFEFFRVIEPDGSTTVYISNGRKREAEPVERDTVWRQRKELSRYFFGIGKYESHGTARENGQCVGDQHEREQFILELVTRSNMLKLGNGASIEDVLHEFAVNSQAAFERAGDGLLRGRETYDIERYDVGADDYSHIKHFSWIYAMELELLQEILAEDTTREVVVVDEGTGFGHFILTARHVLRPDDLARLRFIGTDYKHKDMRFAMDAAAGPPNLKVDWRVEDIDAADHVERLLELVHGNAVDLLVANHILEHLDAKTPTDYLLAWLQAAHTLVVTVPLEDRLEDTISSHMEQFSVDDLATMGREIEQRTGGAVTADLSKIRGGMLVFRHSPTHQEIRRCAELFGWGLVQELRSVYSSVWGCDAYRPSGTSIRGSVVALETVLGTLIEIAAEDGVGRHIAQELAEALRYTSGVTDDQHLMRPIDPDMIRDVADRWRVNRQVIMAHAGDRDLPVEGLEVFARVWAEWTTYLELIERAEELAGRRDVDSFEGISDAAIEAALRRAPGRSRGEIETELATHTHRVYEQADLIGLKTVHKLMRVQPKEIAQMLREGRWTILLQSVVLARLHGEGKFYQSLRLYLDQFSDPAIGVSFWALAERFIEALQSDYRRSRPLDEVDLEFISAATSEFLRSAGEIDIPEQFDFDEAWLKARQTGLRRAESHLGAVELAYARRQGWAKGLDKHPADLYGEAMLSFLDGLDRVNSGDADMGAVLDAYRGRLILACEASDHRYGHDYAFWSGHGEHVGQSRTRALHPRYQLYQLEAHAERMFLAGQLMLEDLLRGTLEVSSVNEAYQRSVEFDESPMYVQEWIARFGPRRSVMFGYEAVETISENDGILMRDAWFREARLRLIDAGADPALWGPMATGYSERLRALLEDRDNGSDAVLRILDSLISAGDVEGLTSAVRAVSPFDFEDPVVGPEPAAVTIGLHIHNAQANVIAETLIHMRELDWPQAARWCVIGSTSSDRAIAREEHRLALELGISRLGMTNRQLLKGGNQNRTIPNAPRLPHRESFYFSLDDDYVAAPLTLWRMVPLLLRDQTSAFVQLPLLFRASVEPGHSIGRQMDASLMLGATGLQLQMLNDPAISLPFGSSTLFRATPGKSALAATGGMVVDPAVSVTAEDFAFGVMATRLRTQPHLFAQVQGSWTEGMFLNEAWVVGDGVDFAPGGQRQKERWTEGQVRTLLFSFIPHLVRSRLKGLGWNALVSLTMILTGYPALAAFGTLIFLLLPALAFTPFVTQFAPLYGYWAWAYAITFWIIPSVIQLYFHRDVGWTLRDFVGTTVMLVYGTYLSILKATIRAVIVGPSRTWSAFKGRRSTRVLQLTHLALGTFLVASGVVGLWHGIWFFALHFLSAAAFFSLWGFHGSSPSTEREKVIRMARDAKETPWKRLTKRLSFPGNTLGLPIRTSATLARRAWLACSLVTAAGIAGLLALTGIVIQELPVFSGLIVLGVAVSFSLLAARRVLDLWLVTRGIEHRDAVRRRMPTVSSGTLAWRIQERATTSGL